MLVVISDLHFEEESSDVIPGIGNHPPVAFSRNLPGRAYRSFIAHLATEAARNGAKKLDLAFAGDIFDRGSDTGKARLIYIADIFDRHIVTPCKIAGQHRPTAAASHNAGD